MRDSAFDETLNKAEGVALGSFEAATTNFFGNMKAENYESRVDELLNADKVIGCKQNVIRKYFWDSILTFFPNKLGRC
jgi:hypothetical protein